jgi:hypothetical protein
LDGFGFLDLVWILVFLRCQRIKTGWFFGFVGFGLDVFLGFGGFNRLDLVFQGLVVFLGCNGLIRLVWFFRMPGFWFGCFLRM